MRLGKPGSQKPQAPCQMPTRARCFCLVVSATACATCCAARRLNWSEPFFRAQSVPTKEPSRWNQRLGTIHEGAGEVMGAPVVRSLTTRSAKPDYALENELPVCGAGAGGCPPGLTRPLALPFGTQTYPLPAGLTGGGTRPPPTPVAASL
jgi:hypothetical protein